MDVADEILSGIASNVREITRLMSVDNSNKTLCLSKVDSCIVHLNSIRGVVSADHVLSVEGSLRSLRGQLEAENDTIHQITTYAFRAPRLSSGNVSTSFMSYIPDKQRIIFSMWNFKLLSRFSGLGPQGQR